MPSKDEIILDFDDFSEKNDRLDLLYRLKSKTPNLKVNLFTVLGRCSDEWVDVMTDVEWIDMIPHGWMHNTNYECIDWGEKEANNYLDKIDKFNLTKGWKSPGWQTPPILYKVLHERGYWIADHGHNHRKWPKGMKAYTLKKGRHHGHIQNAYGNGLEECFDFYAGLKGDFQFIKNII